MLQLDFSIVNIALPSIQAELHVTAASLQWLITGYALTYGSLLLTGLTSLAAGLAPSFTVLVVARFLQGTSAALVAPSALAVLTGIYREGPARTRALSIFQAATAGGATAGIVLGGVLTSYIGWRAIFLVNPPIIAVLAAALPRLLPRDTGQGRTRLDGPGAVFVTISVTSLIYGLSAGEDHGFTTPAAIVAFALSVLLAALFVLAERRAAAPMLPLTLFADPARRAALTAMLMMGGVLAGYLYFISLYLQDSLGFSALTAGRRWSQRPGPSWPPRSSSPGGCSRQLRSQCARPPADLVRPGHRVPGPSLSRPDSSPPPAGSAVTRPEPEPADQCPLSLCGLGGHVHDSGHDTPGRRAADPATG